MPRLVGVCIPPIDPTHDTAVSPGEHFLGGERGGGRGSKKVRKRLTNRALPCMPRAIRSRIGVVENTVLGHKRHDAFKIMTVKSHVEFLNYLKCACRFGIHIMSSLLLYNITNYNGPSSPRSRCYGSRSSCTAR